MKSLLQQKEIAELRQNLAVSESVAAHWRAEHDRINGMYFDRWQELRSAEDRLALLIQTGEALVTVVRQLIATPELPRGTFGQLDAFATALEQARGKPDEPTLPEVTAESLIRAYGDQAYHKGVRLALDALRCGDSKNSRVLSQANLELIRRGYQKFNER